MCCIALRTLPNLRLSNTADKCKAKTFRGTKSHCPVLDRTFAHTHQQSSASVTSVGIRPRVRMALGPRSGLARRSWRRANVATAVAFAATPRVVDVDMIENGPLLRVWAPGSHSWHSFSGGGAVLARGTNASAACVLCIRELGGSMHLPSFLEEGKGKGELKPSSPHLRCLLVLRLIGCSRALNYISLVCHTTFSLSFLLPNQHSDSVERYLHIGTTAQHNIFSTVPGIATCTRPKQ
jgi:hypothetical protein